MLYIDTHTHLYDGQFGDDAEAAVKRALDAGVGKMIFPDIDSTTREAMFGLASKFEGTVYPCIGLHPTSVDSGWKENLDEIEGLAGNGNIRAIGETGMDCYWSREFVREQEEAFERQVRLACRLGLPVIIHSRDATELIFSVLERRNFQKNGKIRRLVRRHRRCRHLQESRDSRDREADSAGTHSSGNRLAVPYSGTSPRRKE